MKLTLPPLGLGLATLLFITIAQPALAQVDDLAFSSFSTPGQANQSCLNDGNGIFICTPVSSDVESSHGVAAIDIDADGDDDLIFAMSKTFQDPESNNRLCLNDGAGVFTCSDISDDQDDTHGVAVADLDDDGDIDLAFANDNGEGATPTDRVCLNNGSTSFTCSDVAESTGESSDVDAVDVDGDSDVDLVFAVWGTNRLCINDGSASFSCTDIAGTSTTSTSVLSYDMDLDGDSDLIFTNWQSRDQICSNDGSGSFTCADVSTDNGDTYGSAAADLDDDGDVDLVFGNAISNDTSRKNTICLNDGTGTFDCSDFSDRTDHTRDVLAADLDADGDIDIVFANERFWTFGPGEGFNRLCRNDGAANFTCENIDNAELGSGAVAVGNFDGVPVAVDDPVMIQGAISLTLDGPNPVNTKTAFVLTLDRPQRAVIDVVDILGRRIAVLHGGHQLSGLSIRVEWNASDMIPGAYFVRAIGESFVQTKPVVVVH